MTAITVFSLIYVCILIADFADIMYPDETASLGIYGGYATNNVLATVLNSIQSRFEIIQFLQIRWNSGSLKTWPGVIKLFSCSTLLSTKFQLILIKTKLPTI